MTTTQAVELILLILAGVCFLVAASAVAVRANMIALGLALWVVVPIIVIAQQ